MSDAITARTEDKIRNLLAKSNGGTAEEYASAMRIAVKLANKAGIDLASLQGDKAPEWTDPAEPVVIIEPKPRAPRWECLLVQGLARSLGCCSYSRQTRGAKGRLLTSQVAHGEVGRIQTLKTLTHVWINEAKTRAKGERAKAAFLTGFVITVLNRLLEVDTIAPEADALVPMDLAKKAQREVEESSGRLRRRAGWGGSVDAGGFTRGAAAAQGTTMPGEAAALRGRLALKA